MSFRKYRFEIHGGSDNLAYRVFQGARVIASEDCFVQNVTKIHEFHSKHFGDMSFTSKDINRFNKKLSRFEKTVCRARLVKAGEEKEEGVAWNGSCPGASIGLEGDCIR